MKRGKWKNCWQHNTCIRDECVNDLTSCLLMALGMLFNILGGIESEQTIAISANSLEASSGSLIIIEYKKLWKCTATPDTRMSIYLGTDWTIILHLVFFCAYQAFSRRENEYQLNSFSYQRRRKRETRMLKGRWVCNWFSPRVHLLENQQQYSAQFSIFFNIK